MPPADSKDGALHYIRNHRSDLPKVGDALKRIIFSEERCKGDAQRLNDYWKEQPDKDILAIRFDAESGNFILTHRLDGDFMMSPEKFYTLVAKKAIQIFSDEISHKIRTLMGSIDNV